MALILVRNHTSLLDGPAVALFLRKKGYSPAVFAVDPDYALHPVWQSILVTFGWLVGGHTMLPLDHQRPQALRKLVKLLNQGRDVVIFPQGTGLKDRDRPEAPGAAWLSRKTQVRTITISLTHLPGSLLPKPYFLTSVSTWKEDRGTC